MIVDIKNKNGKYIHDAFGISQKQIDEFHMDFLKALLASQLKLPPYDKSDDTVMVFKQFVEGCDLKKYGFDPKSQEHMIMLGFAFSTTLQAMKETIGDNILGSRTPHQHTEDCKPQIHAHKIPLNSEQGKELMKILGIKGEAAKKKKK